MKGVVLEVVVLHFASRERELFSKGKKVIPLLTLLYLTISSEMKTNLNGTIIFQEL